METKYINYPEFSANQVLTHDSLNLLRDYLDEQSRLSRVKFSGTGIIRGLTLEKDEAEGTITISKGLGVTSDGYVIEMSEEINKFSGCIKYKMPEELFTDPLYDKWKNKKDEIYELTSDNGAESINKLKLEKYAVILFLEKRITEKGAFQAIGCDSVGKDVSLTVKQLLIPKEKTLDEIDPIYEVEEYLVNLESFANLFPGHEGGEQKDINDIFQKPINEFIAFWDNDKNKEHIKEISLHISLLIDDINSYFGGIDKDTSLTVEKLYDELKEYLQKEIKENKIYQYHYGLLKDFLQAYNELLFAILELRPFSQLNENFPLHLCLGDFDNKPRYRSFHSDLLLSNVERIKLRKAKILYDRLNLIAKGRIVEFKTTNENKDQDRIMINLGEAKYSPLGDRAIPTFYENNIKQYWNPDSPDMSDRVTLSKDLAANSCLKINLEKFDFYRLDGHLGLKKRSAEQAIKEIRDNNNLEFDIRLVDYSNSEDVKSFKKVVQGQSGLRHLAGVVRGGTLFLIYNKHDYIIADFAIDGRICVNQHNQIEEEYNFFGNLLNKLKTKSWGGWVVSILFVAYTYFMYGR